MTKPEPIVEPPITPVDVKSSVPLNVQLAPESLAALGAPPAGTVEPVTAPVAPVATGTPVNVTVMAPPLPPTTVIKGDNVTLTPTTTEAQDKTTEGQRRINEMWEKTQSYIALVVVIGGIFLNALLVLVVVFFNKELSVTQIALVTICLQFVNMTAGIVIGFYFSRTNHEKQGGTGSKPESPYMGR